MAIHLAKNALVNGLLVTMLSKYEYKHSLKWEFETILNNEQEKIPHFVQDFFVCAQDWISCADPTCPTRGLRIKIPARFAHRLIFCLSAFASKLAAHPNKKSRTSCRTFLFVPFTGLSSSQISIDLSSLSEI